MLRGARAVCVCRGVGHSHLAVWTYPGVSLGNAQLWGATGDKHTELSTNILTASALPPRLAKFKQEAAPKGKTQTSRAIAREAV